MGFTTESQGLREKGKPLANLVEILKYIIDNEYNIYLINQNQIESKMKV
jgi:hypothetical protein